MALLYRNIGERIHLRSLAMNVLSKASRRLKNMSDQLTMQVWS